MKLQDFQINHQHYIMKKAKPTLKNIIAYIQGNLRYKLFYSNFAFLIRPHIREQIQVRINSMDKQCYNEGQCKMCGCQTTALQMADKACDKPCYPEMMDKVTWNKFKRGIDIYNVGYWWTYWEGIVFKRHYKSFEDEIDIQLKPNSKLEESDVELFKACEADIKILESYTLEDLKSGKLIKEAIVPNNNCK